MKCVNIKLPGIKELVDTFGEIQTSKILDKFPDKIPSIEEASKYANSPEINYQLKAVSLITNNLKDIQLWIKQLGGLTDKFWEKVQQKLQIPKEQLELLRSSEGNTIEEKLLDFVSKYSFAIEINTAKGFGSHTSYANSYYMDSAEEEESYWVDVEGNETVTNTVTKYNIFNPDGHIINTFKYKEEAEKELNKLNADKPNSSYYQNLTVPGGTNYTENEISTPLITPSIKGHAAFSTNSGIGWFRSDEKQNYTEQDINTLITNMKNSGVLEINCS